MLLFTHCFISSTNIFRAPWCWLGLINFHCFIPKVMKIWCYHFLWVLDGICSKYAFSLGALMLSFC
uniref:Uncharacterized protein n=1 Tax=Rhizophora mucronata TaxID=61149 RepID=A0A2P2PDC4_RHIMU